MNAKAISSFLCFVLLGVCCALVPWLICFSRRWSNSRVHTLHCISNNIIIDNSFLAYSYTYLEYVSGPQVEPPRLSTSWPQCQQQRPGCCICSRTSVNPDDSASPFSSFPGSSDLCCAGRGTHPTCLPYDGTILTHIDGPSSCVAEIAQAFRDLG